MGKIAQLAQRGREILARLNDASLQLSGDERQRLIIELETLDCQLDDTEWSVEHKSKDEFIFGDPPSED